MELEAFLLDCVRHQIPRDLLRLLGDEYVLILKVEGYLNEVRKMTCHDVPNKLWRDAARYVAHLVKHEVYCVVLEAKRDDKQVGALRPGLREVAFEYNDCHDVALGAAAGIMNKWSYIKREIAANGKARSHR
jgi:predicted secreted protein